MKLWSKYSSATFICTKWHKIFLQQSLILDFVLLTAIKNVAKDKIVNRGSSPSYRGSNDISVIVDGDRDGKITATPIDPQDITNSQVECTACYISTPTNMNLWITIDLVEKYSVTEINIFTGELLVNYNMLCCYNHLLFL